MNNTAALKDEEVTMAKQRPLAHPVSPVSLPAYRHIDGSRPSAWLNAGWSDLRRNPYVSLGYSLLIVLLYGAIILFSVSTRWYHVGLQLTAAFIVAGPVLTLGLYGLSRRADRGERAGFRAAFASWRANAKGVLGVGSILLLLLLSWLMLGMQVTAWLAGSEAEMLLLFGADDLGQFVDAMVTAAAGPVGLGWLVVSAAVLLVAFALSAFSLPMLMEHPAMDPISAVVASWGAVVANWKPMLSWAILIAALTFTGLLFGYIGLAVSFALLGHATWHAYRDVFPADEPHTEAM